MGSNTSLRFITHLKILVTLFQATIKDKSKYCNSTMFLLKSRTYSISENLGSGDNNSFSSRLSEKEYV